MNSISSQKKSIFGGIAALKTITENSALRLGQAYAAGVSEYNNIMGVLLDIYNQLGGFDELMETIENILFRKMDDIELIIKGTIKTAIKQIISCGVEPNVDITLIETGVTFSLGKIDPQSFLTIDPTTENGKLIYFDNENDLNSKDFNTFLYSVISEGISNQSSTGHTWRNENSIPLLDVAFKEFDINSGSSNVVTIKINQQYLNKKLSSFISDYLDSVKLFNKVQLLSSIFDDIVGSKIFSINKTAEQISAEKIIEKLCDNILNNVNETDVLDDSFYVFSNDTYNQILEDSELKLNGVFAYSVDINKNSVVDENIVISSMLDIKNTENMSEQISVIRNTIDSIVENAVKNNENITEKDKFALKLNFVRNIISKLMTTVTLFIFSPKIMFLFVMIGKIYGISDSDNIVDFVKKNVNIYKIIIVKIRDIITTEITNKIIEMLYPMITKSIAIINTEKIYIYKKQLDDIRELITSAVRPLKVI